MPEGPECKHIVDILRIYLSHQKITNITILGGRYKKHQPPKGWDLLMDKLTISPILVEEIQVKGKFIYWKLGDLYLWNTLGMSGQWLSGNKIDKHCHIEFELENGNYIYFRDVRRFGTIKIVNSKLEMDKKLNSIGCDILMSTLEPEKCLQLFRSKNNWCLPKFLMNQSYLSGVGNYLKSEALYASNLSPHRLIKDLNDIEILTCYQELIRIAGMSYLSKGASFHSYLDPENNTGNFSFSFQIYGKTKINDEIVKRETTKDKRTTYWLPSKQY